MKSFLKQIKWKFDSVLIFFLLGSLIKRYMFSLMIDERIEKGYFFIVLGSTVLIASIYFALKPRLGKIYLWLWSVLFSAILLVNLWHFRYFQFPFSMFEVVETSNLHGLGPSIFQQIRWVDVIFVFDVIAFPFIKARDAGPVFKKNFKKAGVFLLIGCLLISIKPIKVEESDNLTLKEMFTVFDKTQFVLRWSVMTYTFVDAYNFLTSRNQVVLSKTEKDEIQQWFKKHKARYFVQMGSNPYSGIGKGKNLIAIQVESLEDFVINNKINGQEITPNLNRLLKNSLYFTDLAPEVKGGNSSDAELLFNTSLYPISEGSTFYRYPFSEYNSLSAMLKEMGYSAFAMHGDKGSFWNRKQAYPGLGFSEFYDLSKFKTDDMVGMGLSDESFFKQALSILKKEKQPFYSFLITLSSHTPFTIPDHLKTLRISEDAGTMAGYLQSIHYTDQAIGDFIANLDKEGLLQNSIVVIYGDHPALQKSYEEQVAQNYKDLAFVGNGRKIPFIIFNPEINGQKFVHQGSQLDMLPTVADVMGISENRIAYSAMGRDLLRTGISQDEAIPDEDLKISELLISSNYFKNNRNIASK